MQKILFVCLGNICRSPMAEFVLKDMLKKRGLTKQFEVASVATSSEELGNPVHRGTRQALGQRGISCAGKYAVQMERADYDHYDILVGMESSNIASMKRIAGGDPDEKIHRLLDYSSNPRDIADPWYTGEFERTYADVVEGCEALLQAIL